MKLLQIAAFLIAALLLMAAPTWADSRQDAHRIGASYPGRHDRAEDGVRRLDAIDRIMCSDDPLAFTRALFATGTVHDRQEPRRATRPGRRPQARSTRQSAC